MEQFFVETFGKYAIWVIPVFAGILCSFIIEAINSATSAKIKGSTVTLIVCLAVGVLLIFGFPSIVTGWFDMVVVALMNAAVALVFYHIGGKKLVKFIIGRGIEKIMNKADKIGR